MKKKFLLFISILLVLIGFCGQAWSTSINIAGDYTEDYSDGTIFDYYQNSGSLVGVYSGNDDDLNEIEGYINDWYITNYGASVTISTEHLTLSITGWDSSLDGAGNPIGDVTIGIAKVGEEYKVDDVSSGYYSGRANAFKLY